MRIRSLCVAFSAIALRQVTGQSLPPVHQLSHTDARSTQFFRSVGWVLQMPDGRAMVEDWRGRTVSLVDSSLVVTGAIADTSGRPGVLPYGRAGFGVLRFRADSSLVVDPNALTMTVVTPRGVLGRTIAVPRPDDVSALNAANGVGAAAGFDVNGDLVYKSSPRVSMNGAGAGMGVGPAASGSVAAAPQAPLPTSAPIVRVNLASHRVDTIATIGIWVGTVYHPFPPIDDWAVLTDGTLAVVRGRDFHVDFFAAGGQVQSGPRIPFAWEHLTDDDKSRVIDSIRPSLGPFVGSDPYEAGLQARVASDLGLPAGKLAIVDPGQMPDYRTPFIGKAVFADADDHLWIRTTASVATPGSQVYDVVDRSGALIDRVQLPPSRSLVGFGRGGTVYLSVRETGGILLERAHR